MQTFEILTTLLTLPPILILLLLPRMRRALIYWCLPLAVALVIHLRFEGAHWQLIPLYAATLLLVLSRQIAPHLSRWGAPLCAITSLLLIAAAVALSWLVPMFQLPKPTGQYAVGTRIFHLVDQNRPERDGPSPSGKRELIAQAWYPAEAPKSFFAPRAMYQRRREASLLASYRSVLRTNSYQDAAINPGGPYPILLYNAGWMGERTEGTYQMEELASHGFVVVAIDHTFYGGLIEFPGGRVTDSHSVPELGNFENSTVDEQWALGSHYVHIEADDDTFVLNQLEAMNQNPKSDWFHKLDMTRVGAMGFSIGGAVAAQTAYQDPRVKGALNLDGWTFGDAGLHGLPKPWMVIYEDRKQVLTPPEELNSGPLPSQRMKQADAHDYGQVTSSMSKSGGYLLFVAGTRHVDFTDRALFSPLKSRTGGGDLPPSRTHLIANAYTLAFFSHILNGTNEPLLNTAPSPFPEVDLQRFPGEDRTIK